MSFDHGAKPLAKKSVIVGNENSCAHFPFILKSVLDSPKGILPILVEDASLCNRDFPDTPSEYPESLGKSFFTMDSEGQIIGIMIEYVYCDREHGALPKTFDGVPHPA